ncbi:HAMP domain-containing sensor histidine kinase [Rhodobacteraceae bacterium KMM 6894]|nr:HAMP domain-containing sensor histidine kinase [Rhodobacteraceae bacterium KMM 6894]
MSVSTFLFGPRRSLKRRLLLNIIAALSLCMVVAGVVLINEFNEHLADNLEEAMIGEAKEVIGQIDPSLPGFGLNPDALRFRGVDGNFRYTVFADDGRLVAGGEASDAIWQQLAKLQVGAPRSVTLVGERIGLGLRTMIMDQDYYVLVSTFPKGNNETRLSKLLHEIEEEIWWGILAVLMVISAARFATRRSLAPLRVLSEQAREIGPLAANRRLDAARLPAEFVPLITDVNEAFARLEQGYKAQRDFSSNVAHEIRTPIAVLRSSIDRIEDADLAQTLSQDAEHLDRIFSQLIDLARADAASISGFETVDLYAVAVDTATGFAQGAVRNNRTLSVTGTEQAKVGGNTGLLSIALGNLIRNALHFTAEHSEVEIEVLSDPAGWRVLDRGPGVPEALKSALFERFNRGAHSSSNSSGSGIGLAIVKSVADCHNATVTIENRRGGGSVFSFIFNGSRL